MNDKPEIKGNGPEQPKNEPSGFDQVNGPKDAPTIFSDGLLFATLVSGNVRCEKLSHIIDVEDFVG